MFLKRSLPVVTLIAVLGAGCSSSMSDRGSGVLARVGNELLTVREARAEIPGFLLKQDSISAYHSYRENWIRSQLILQEAERLQIDRNEEVQERMEKLRKDLLKQALKDYVLADYSRDLTVTDTEAREYYQTHKNQFVLNERYVRFRHLVAETIEEARAAKRDLGRGIEWPIVARKYGVNPEALIHRSTQFWPISMALPDAGIMNTMLRRIGISERSPIHRVNGNYHFVQLMETRAEGDHPDLDWLIDQIKDWLLVEKKRRHFNSYIKNLYLKAESNNEIESYNVYQDTAGGSPPRADTLESQ